MELLFCFSWLVCSWWRAACWHRGDHPLHSPTTPTAPLSSSPSSATSTRTTTTAPTDTGAVPLYSRQFLASSSLGFGEVFGHPKITNDWGSWSTLFQTTRQILVVVSGSLRLCWPWSWQLLTKGSKRAKWQMCFLQETIKTVQSSQPLNLLTLFPLMPWWWISYKHPFWDLTRPMVKWEIAVMFLKLRFVTRKTVIYRAHLSPTAN